MPSKNIASTRRGNTIYVHVLRPESAPIKLPPIPQTIRSARVLTGGKAVVSQDGAGITLTLEPATPAAPAHGAALLAGTRDTGAFSNGLDIVVKLDLSDSAMSLPAVPLAAPAQVKATASNVFQKDAKYGADKAFDGDSGSRWATDRGTQQAWIAAALPSARPIEGVRIEEALSNRVRQFSFEYRAGAEWKPLFSGTTIGKNFNRKFAPVTASEFRLNIEKAVDGPTLAEIELLEK
jgi:hypothetical protein